MGKSDEIELDPKYISTIRGLVDQLVAAEMRSDKFLSRIAALRDVLGEANSWLYLPASTGINSIDLKKEKDYLKFCKKFDKALEDTRVSSEALEARVRIRAINECAGVLRIENCDSSVIKILEDLEAKAERGLEEWETLRNL